MYTSLDTIKYIQLIEILTILRQAKSLQSKILDH